MFENYSNGKRILAISFEQNAPFGLYDLPVLKNNVR
jgi:hypothetical protein